MNQHFRVGVDVGGTFTDIVFLSGDGHLHTKKISSSVGDYSRSVLDGIATVKREQGGDAIGIEAVLHGTTLGSNTILEGRGARTGLLTTKGFRDTLEIRNMRTPRLYDIRWRKPAPLVPRHLRLEIDERLDAGGAVLRPLDEDGVAAAAARLVEEHDIEGLSICFLHAFTNPVHEVRAREIVHSLYPDLLVCLASEVLPEIREYERTSTTVINTYVKPVIASYLRTLSAGLSEISGRAPLLMMQSSGGLMAAETAAEFPVHIIESGPAGGVVGAQALAAALGLEEVVSFDMGGTTAKAAIIEKGRIGRAQQYEVGGGILTGARLSAGDGYLLKVGAIDIAEVGAGGGSLVHLDAAGGLRVGPRSAGSVPGPLCYDAGGDDPTVTDANLILGYINPDHLVGGEMRLAPERTRREFKARIADPLGLPLEAAAFGAYRIAVSNMMRAVRAVSTERGRDPRAFALVAFGGNGPLFGAALAAEMGMREVIVPPAAGLFSSFGFLYADEEQEASMTVRRPAQGSSAAAIAAEIAELERVAIERLAPKNPSRMVVRRSAILRYRGQSLELSIDLAQGAIDEDAVERLRADFEDEHERTFGHRGTGSQPVEVVRLSCRAAAARDGERVPKTLLPGRTLPPVEVPFRRCYFGPDLGWRDTPVIRRAALDADRQGPLIIEEYDATCLVPPGARARLDGFGCVRITLEP